MKLNLGCGNSYMKGWVNADFNKLVKADIYFDAERQEFPFPDNHFDEIYADNVFEHFDKPEKVFEECHRVLKDGGVLDLIVPYYNCWTNFGDVTHRTSYSELSFNYFVKDAFMTKKFGFQVGTRKFSSVEIEFYYSMLGKFLRFLIPTHKFCHYLPNTVVAMRVKMKK